MQINKNDYNPELHDQYRGLSVKQPYADLLTNVVYRDDQGEYHAEKSIEVRTKNTNYRGDVLVCSSKNPQLPGRLSGVTCGLVELYDVKRVEDFTQQDWENTCIPENERPSTGFGWMMRNPRRVVEMPVNGQLGFYAVVVPKGDIVIYPQNMVIGKDGWDIIQKRLKE